MTHSEIADRIAVLKSMFVRNRRIETLSEEFGRQLALRRAEIRHKVSAEANGIALVGESGSGKSTALRRIFERHPDIAPLSPGSAGATVVSFLVPSPATLKFVGHQALNALGYPIQRDRPAAYLWDMVKFHLRERKTLFLHLDEAQDLYSKRNNKEMQSVVNILKSIMQNRDWPVSVILSGLPELRDLLNLDPQLGRRMKPIRFDRIDADTWGAEIESLISKYSEKSEITAPGEIMKPIFRERLVHASDGQFGIVVELIIGALEEVMLAGRTEATCSDFAAAYQRRTGCLPGFNPFVVEDFRRIDSRLLLTDGHIQLGGVKHD